MNLEGTPDDIRGVAENLITAFCWARTPQGHEYWFEVYNNLCALANQQEAEQKE